MYIFRLFGFQSRTDSTKPSAIIALVAHSHTYAHNPLERTVRYTAYKEDGAERYNRIDVDDFWYMEKLGEGAFGKVVCTRNGKTYGISVHTAARVCHSKMYVRCGFMMAEYRNACGRERAALCGRICSEARILMLWNMIPENLIF